jgi:hypothetical protein
MPTLPNTLRRSPPPPCGQLIGASSHFLNESSLKDCTASNCTPQVLQRYSYVGISVMLQRRLCVPTVIPTLAGVGWHSGKASAKCSACPPKSSARRSTKAVHPTSRYQNRSWHTDQIRKIEKSLTGKQAIQRHPGAIAQEKAESLRRNLRRYRGVSIRIR